MRGKVCPLLLVGLLLVAQHPVAFAAWQPAEAWRPSCAKLCEAAGDQCELSAWQEDNEACLVTFAHDLGGAAKPGGAGAHSSPLAHAQVAQLPNCKRP